MEGLFCIAFVLCVFTVQGEEVLLKDLPEEDAERYELDLKKAVGAYNGKVMKTLYNLRLVNQTTVEEGESGNLTLNFYTLLMKCSIGIQVIQEIDGTETVLVYKKNFNLIDPKCKPHVTRRTLRRVIYEAEKVKNNVHEVRRRLHILNKKLRAVKFIWK